jgi:hypothetical protein
VRYGQIHRPKGWAHYGRAADSGRLFPHGARENVAEWRMSTCFAVLMDAEQRTKKIKGSGENGQNEIQVRALEVFFVVLFFFLAWVLRFVLNKPRQ